MNIICSICNSYANFTFILNAFSRWWPSTRLKTNRFMRSQCSIEKLRLRICGGRQKIRLPVLPLFEFVDIERFEKSSEFETRSHFGLMLVKVVIAVIYVQRSYRLKVYRMVYNQSSVLEYFFYLCQVGIAMSVSSNNGLVMKFKENPFKTFFEEGQNVSISDDPLQFHSTKEPLLEEYSIVAIIWDLSTVEKCEVALNSVMQSGLALFVSRTNKNGSGTSSKRLAGNDMNFTNVPNTRVKYIGTMLL